VEAAQQWSGNEIYETYPFNSNRFRTQSLSFDVLELFKLQESNLGERGKVLLLFTRLFAVLSLVGHIIRCTVELALKRIYMRASCVKQEAGSICCPRTITRSKLSWKMSLLLSFWWYSR